MVSEGRVGNVRPVKIEEEMRASYLDYAMSVIVARALPDVRDGLKPVQRRILYAMDELGLRPGAPYKKSARIVGEVLGKYHPHGDDPVYEAMVRMAQGFSLRYPLVDGQGNFGSVDNDPPAAMRYTEARLAAIAQEMLADIDRNTVDFVPNFDDSLREPVVLPARLPNLLVNGASGIAVGMATNIPPHNLGEVCDAIIHLIDHPEATTEELMTLIQGPDFPTGGLIVGREGIRNAYSQGHGRIILRARAFIEEMSRAGRYQIVVKELPYQVNKAALVEKIAELVRDKHIDGIADLRDESDRQGLRIVIEVKRESEPRKVLNALYKHTAMQSTFAVNMLALVDGQPRTLRLKEMLEHYIAFRREVIRRRAQFDLGKARDRGHILEGLLKALDNLNQVIALIRRSPSAEEAKRGLMGRPFNMSERQALAVLDMQLRRLAALERQKIQDEYAEIIRQIAYLEDLLANPRKVDYLIKEDARGLKKRFDDGRRTQVLEQEAQEFTAEDLIPHQETVVTLSARGYVKRMALTSYRPQRRGGRGISGMQTREADAVRHLAVADTHDSLLFFTDRGRVYQLKVYELPDASRQARGIPLINLLNMEQGEGVTAVVTMRNGPHSYLVLATRRGEVKKTALAEFASVRSSGIIAMDLEPGDELVGVELVGDGDEVLLISQGGQAVRFSVDDLRSASRQSGGVRGIRLAPGDRVVATAVARPGHDLLVVTAKGFGKRTAVKEYPTHNRGGVGVITFKTNARTGPVATARAVKENQELMVISADGIVLRTPVESITRQGRATQGVSIMRLGAGDSVAAIACVDVAEGPKEGKAGGRRPQRP